VIMDLPHGIFSLVSSTGSGSAGRPFIFGIADGDGNNLVDSSFLAGDSGSGSGRLPHPKTKIAIKNTAINLFTPILSYPILSGRQE
jgi:hypothetical protein